MLMRFIQMIILLSPMALATSAEAMMLIKKVGFDNREYVNLLGTMIAHTEHLQNNPSAGQIPQERLIAEEITNYLGKDLAGLSVSVHSYDPEGKRPNLILRYKHPEAPPSDKIITFMGSHMDVVPADANDWHRNPFGLSIEDYGSDLKLHGRGTTDCLGHVALITMMMKRLAQAQVVLSHEIAAVFIADEEQGHANVGVFRLYHDKLLDDFKRGPIYWVDTATDEGLFGPRVGTGGNGQWTVTITGREGHSGYPHLCINPISVADELKDYINRRFSEDFQNAEAMQKAKFYWYPTGSNCKCTHIHAKAPSKNIIPGECTFGGDVRFTPDFKSETIKHSIPKYIEEFKHLMRTNKINISASSGGNYYLTDGSNNKHYADIKFTWDSDEFLQPFVVDMKSPAYKFVIEAMKKVRGLVVPFSALGSLPLIAELSHEGFSLVPIGFGRQKAYHAPNEYCMLSEMRDGYKVMLRVIDYFESGRGF